MAFNFANLIKPGVIPPVPERFRVRGQRTNLATKEVKHVRIECELNDRGNGEHALWIVVGGVTPDNTGPLLDWIKEKLS